MTPAGAFVLGAILTGLLWLWASHIGSGLWAHLKARWSERGEAVGAGRAAGRWSLTVRPARAAGRRVRARVRGRAQVTQPLEALAQANRVRSEQVRVLRELRSADPAEARRHLSDLILSPPAEVRTMSVERLMRGPRLMGKVRAGRALRRAEVLPTRLVGQLTPRQRMALAEEMGS